MPAWPLGKLLASARVAAGIRSARAAAKLAGFDEATWRNLESGTRKVAAGVEVPYKPTEVTLVKACRAVGVDPAMAFAMLGWEFDADEWPEDQPGADIEERVSRLEAHAARTEATLDLLLRAQGLEP